MVGWASVQLITIYVCNVELSQRYKVLHTYHRIIVGPME